LILSNLAGKKQKKPDQFLEFILRIGTNGSHKNKNCPTLVLPKMKGWY
jgi:hypothetical protein